MGLEEPLEEEMHPTPVFLLESPMDRRARQATVLGLKKNQPQKKQLSTYTKGTWED